MLYLSTWAQSQDRVLMVMGETRVLDADIYKKNYPAIRNWWMKALPEITYNRSGYTSESGRAYSLAFFQGDKNLGAYMAKRSELTSKIENDLKGMVEEQVSNAGGPTMRSVWARVNNNTIMEPGFKIENYDFRKIVMYSVPYNKTKEFEALVEAANKEDQAIGIKYNYIVYKCVDGYPTNTYLLFLPAKSRIDYYSAQDERNAKRKGNEKLRGLSKQMAALRTSIRLDHLTRIP